VDKGKALTIREAALWLVWGLSVLMVGVFYVLSLNSLWIDDYVRVSSEGSDSSYAMAHRDGSSVNLNAEAMAMLDKGGGVSVDLPSTDTLAAIVTGATLVAAIGAWLIFRHRTQG
jgi:hypothetical protein